MPLIFLIRIIPKGLFFLHLHGNLSIKCSIGDQYARPLEEKNLLKTIHQLFPQIGPKERSKTQERP